MTKKILLTGFNRNQCTPDYWRQQELQVVLAQHSITRCLEDMGWEVEHREVQLGEDLSGYDEVLVFIHNVTGYAHALYSGLYALHARPDAIFAFDDWQVKIMMGAADKLLEHVDAGTLLYTTGNHRFYKDYVLGIQMTKRSVEEISKYESQLFDGLRVLCSRKNRLILTLFEGGDESLLGLNWKPGMTFPFNPNPYHYRRTPENGFLSTNPLMSGGFGPVSPDDKKRSWVFASLLHNRTKKWIDRLNPEWPVRMFGQRKGEGKSERVTEDQMCQFYADNWGCLIPPYDTSGSGWWRTRVLQVADAGSVLLADEREAAVYGEAYTGLTVDRVEGMTTDGLAKLARNQKECLMEKHPLDRGVAMRQMTRILEATE